MAKHPKPHPSISAIPTLVEPIRLTYWNHLAGERLELLDGLDRETAASVVRTWGDPNRPAFYLPELQAESQA
jgi:hypothetical protein